MESIVQRSELFSSDAVLLGLFAEVIEIALFSFGSTLDEHILAVAESVERARHNLARLIREMGANLSKFTNMEILQCAAAHRCAYAQARIVIENKFPCAIDRCGSVLLDTLWELVISELDALEHMLGVFSRVCYDACGHIGLEKTGI